MSGPTFHWKLQPWTGRQQSYKKRLSDTDSASLPNERAIHPIFTCKTNTPVLKGGTLTEKMTEGNIPQRISSSIIWVFVIVEVLQLRELTPHSAQKNRLLISSRIRKKRLASGRVEIFGARTVTDPLHKTNTEWSFPGTTWHTGACTDHDRAVHVSLKIVLKSPALARWVEHDNAGIPACTSGIL